MPEFDQSLYWKLVPYFRVPMERVHVILVVSGPSARPEGRVLRPGAEASVSQADLDTPWHDR